MRPSAADDLPPGASGIDVAGAPAAASAAAPATRAAVARGRVAQSPPRSAVAVVAPAVEAPAVASVGAPVVVPEAVAVAATESAGPDPWATVATDYGDIGKWMLRNGKVADWVDLPFCDPECKTMQEPINMVFVVEAADKWQAELRLDGVLRRAGFGPSPFSSIGYSGIVGDVDSPQMPRGGIFGFGFLPPLPFGLGGQNGIIPLLAPFGYGAAYRDAPFWEANAHLRTFGGIADGDGNYIFTASVSDEVLIPSGGLLPTHGYQSFVKAREELAAEMMRIGASNEGVIDLQNQIAASDPVYTTGDHDGYATVIGIPRGRLVPTRSRLG